MFEAPESKYLVPFDGSFDVSEASTTPQTDAPRHKGKYRRRARRNLGKLQRVLAAAGRHAVLLVFQAMDAAGKDSTIRAVMQGIDPSGCQVFSFKKPSNLELDHDFLWRTTCHLPERGRIGIFNRSQYEEVLIARVRPKILASQKLPGELNLETIWDQRLTSIRQQEEHLARNGTVILKFWLNVSRDEQKKRFLARLDDPAKNWKFEPGDVIERREWGAGTWVPTKMHSTPLPGPGRRGTPSRPTTNPTCGPGLPTSLSQRWEASACAIRNQRQRIARNLRRPAQNCRPTMSGKRRRNRIEKMTPARRAFDLPKELFVVGIVIDRIDL